MIRVSEASETTESDIAFLMQKRPSQPSSVETWWWFVSPQPGSRLVPLVCHMWCYRDIAWVAIVIANDENINFFCYLLMPMMKLSISIYDLEYEPMKRPSSYAIFSCSILFVLLMQWPHVLYAFYWFLVFLEFLFLCIYMTIANGVP